MAKWNFWLINKEVLEHELEAVEYGLHDAKKSWHILTKSQKEKIAHRMEIATTKPNKVIASSIVAPKTVMIDAPSTDPLPSTQ